MCDLKVAPTSSHLPRRTCLVLLDSSRIEGGPQLTFAEADGFPAGVGEPSAIDAEGVAVDEGAFGVVGEEGDGAGDVVGPGEAAHGDALRDVGVGVAAAGLVGVVHFGFHPAGADGVDANAAPAPLGGERAGEADEAVLRGVVGGAVAYGEESGDGGDVDDGAATRGEHRLAEGFGEQEGRDEVHFEDAAVVGGGGLLGGSDVADAGVIDQHVDASPRVENAARALRDEGFIGHVSGEGEGLAATGFDGLHGRGGFTQIDEGEAIAALGDEFGGAAADTLGGSGDDSDALFAHEVLCSAYPTEVETNSVDRQRRAELLCNVK